MASSNKQDIVDFAMNVPFEFEAPQWTAVPPAADSFGSETSSFRGSDGSAHKSSGLNQGINVSSDPVLPFTVQTGGADASFSTFGGGAGTGGDGASFNVSGLFAPAPVGGAGSKWGAALPLESPIVARTHSVIQGPDMKTPGFMVNKRSNDLNESREGEFDPVPAFAMPVQPSLTVPITPKFATAHRQGGSRVESTEEREMREIREAKERQREERQRKEQRMQRAIQGQAPVAAQAVIAAPLTQPQSPHFATDARAAAFSRSGASEEAQEEQGGQEPMDEGADDGEQLDTRNAMFFNIPASSKPVVERKFALRSDRRAALRRKQQRNEPAPSEGYVGLAEALHRVQQQEQQEEEARAQGNDDNNDGEDGGRVGIISIAPFHPTIAKTPNFATRHRARAPTEWRTEPAVPAAPTALAPAQHVPMAPITRPEVTVGKTPNFATRHRARREPLVEVEEADAQPERKKYRTRAAKKASAEGGAVGVPMIPKAALTRPEEFDFATAARALAIEEGIEAATGVPSTRKQRKRAPDVFEKAAMDVATTANKIGMYVDLDEDLDQDVAVAQLATTGRKRNPGRSRLPGPDDSDIMQPDFGGAAVDAEPEPQRKRERAPQPAPAALTVPKTPKFATTARAAAHRPVVVEEPRRDPSPKRRAPSPIRRSAAPRVEPTLTVPETPKFATTARARAHQAVPPVQQQPVAEPKRQPRSAPVVAHVEPELTEPKPFSFATSARAANSVRSVAAPAPAASAPPARRMQEADKYSTALALTEPQPFSFATNARLGSRAREENAHPNQIRRNEQPQQQQFGGLTNPQPFNLRVEVRGAVAKEVLEQKVRAEEEEMRRRANFKAKPFVDVAPHYAPRPAPALTETHDVVLNSDVRAARRAEFEEAERQRRQQAQREEEERERERLRREEQEIREMRKRMVHKARPIQYEQTAPAPRKMIALTVPESPKFATSKRFHRVV